MNHESARDLNKIVEDAAEIVGWDDLQRRFQVSRQTIWNWKTRYRSPSAAVVVECLKIKQDFDENNQVKVGKRKEIQPSEDEFS